MTLSSRDDHLDDLVRGHLDRETASVDAASVLAGVRARQARLSLRGRIVRWGAGFVGIAAAVWLLVVGLTPSPASAETLLLQASEVHAAPVDRLYRVETQLELNWLRHAPVISLQRKVQLWTRGDRFALLTSGENHHWAWGKDEKGRYWLALNSKIGLIFNPDELEDVSVTTDLFSMKIESLLAELPRGFDLKRDEISDRPGFVRVIATPKRPLPNQRLREASVEIETASKVVHQLTVKRTVRGETVATVTYTLIDTKMLPYTHYQLTGHLEADGTQLGPDTPVWRNSIWKRVLERRGKE